MKFDIEKTVSYWVEGAEYDLSVTEALYEKEKYPYALFMGHLSLEKLLKAIVVKETKNHAPITHSLPLLAKETVLEIPESITIKLRKFMEFYFEPRYPRERKIFYTKCTKKYTKEKLDEIKEVYKWLKEKL